MTTGCQGGPWDDDATNQPRIGRVECRETAAPRGAHPAVRVTVRDVIRPKIVLLAAAGLASDAIATRLDTPPADRQQVAQALPPLTLAGARRAPRGGCQGRFSPSVVVAVKALACELPYRCGGFHPAAAALGSRSAMVSKRTHYVSKPSGYLIFRQHSYLWNVTTRQRVRPWMHGPPLAPSRRGGGKP
jgi:hypothetical protein